jgi:hypothetical protein
MSDLSVPRRPYAMSDLAAVPRGTPSEQLLRTPFDLSAAWTTMSTSR